MKNLLKILSFVTTVAASLLTAGCGNELDERNLGESPSSFTASIEQEGATKTLMGVKYTSGSTTYRPVEWVTGDQIAISGASANYTAGTLTNNDRTATFTGSGAQMEGGLYKAYYPATIYNKTSKKTSFPATQTYGGQSGSKTVIGDLPMYAASSTTSLTFRNLCAVLNFRLKGESTQKVTEIVVTSSDKNLWGEFTIGGTPESPTVTMNTATGGRAVTLKCGAGVALSPTMEKDFFIAIPAQTYLAGDLTIQIKDGATTLATLTNSSATSAQTTFSRNQIYEIGKDTQPSGNFVFTVTDPTDLAYTAGTSTTGRVVSYKETGATRTPVAWTVEGYYPTEADAQNQTNAYTNLTATNFLNSFNPASLTGSTSGEVVSIGYRAATSTTTTESPYNMALTRLRSNAGAYVERGTASNPWNLANPQTGSRDYIEETANTYIVNAPGYYCIPMVMGNIIGNPGNVVPVPPGAVTYDGGTDFSSALTPSASDFAARFYSPVNVRIEGDDTYKLPDESITSSSVTINGISRTIYWLNFHIKKEDIQPGYVVLGLAFESTSSGSEVCYAKWSWTIWVTDYVPYNYPTYNASSDMADVECIYDTFGSKVMFMPVNLGWSDNSGSSTSGTKYSGNSVFVRVKQSGSNEVSIMKVVRPEGFKATGDRRGHSPYYQFGRKDPIITYNNFLNSTGYHNSSHSAPSSPPAAIMAPYGYNVNFAEWCQYIHSNNTSEYFWKYYSKTVYDPCPPGYCMPSSSHLDCFDSYYAKWTSSGAYVWSRYQDQSASIYFPGTGMIYPGGAVNSSNRGMYWAREAPGMNGAETGACLQFAPFNTQINVSYQTRSTLMAVRPVRRQ